MPYKNVCKTDSKGNIYVAGATLNVGSGDYDCFLRKIDSKGNQLWMQTFGGAGLDFLSDLFILHDTAVYVTGLSSNASPDVVTIKYTNMGVERWHQFFDGAYYSYDCGGALIADDSGNVFVTGGSFESSMLSTDMCLLKYSNVGMLMNSAFYNNTSSNMNDVANKICFDAGGKYVIIGGATQTGANDYHYATANFYRTNLSFGFSYVSTATSSTSMDEVKDMKTDATGIYIAGKVKAGTLGYNICLIKLDTALNVVYTAMFDGGYGMDDEANAMELDNAGNVYLTGYISRTATEKKYNTRKLNSSGVLQWSVDYGDSLHGDSEATGIALDANGNICVTGFSPSGVSDLDYYTIKYDNATGAELWHIRTDGNHMKDYPSNVVIDDAGRIIVTGQTETGVGSYKYKTVQYIENKKVPDMSAIAQVLNGSGEPSYLKDVLIVKFDRSVLNMDNVNIRGLNCSQASTFIKDSMIYLMGKKLFTNTNTDISTNAMGSVTTKKLFSNMTQADSISVTRIGEKMRVPDFWTTFILYDVNRLSARSAIDSLRKLFPGVIYSQPDFIGNFDNSQPNDALYDSSASLHPTVDYPNASINVEDAWAITTGDPKIKIGVYDTGIDSLQPDLDVYKRVLFDEGLTGIETHGTAVAGIIGAKRNNSIGVAGIAGGNGTTGSGCKIYDCDTGQDDNLFLSDAAQGIVYGASNIFYTNSGSSTGNNPNNFTGYHGLGLNAMNCSWSARIDSPERDCIGCDTTYELPPESDFCPLCHEALQYAYRNGVSVVASRGNAYTGTADLTDYRFPACEKDELVLGIGSSGKDGLVKTDQNGENAGEYYYSMRGRNMDLLAPGTRAIVRTTRRQYTGSTLPDSLCRSFSGTSSAAPHVTGIVGLMMSEVNTPCASNKNLSPEDVEYILQRTAPNASTAYNSNEGWGLVNAGKALKAIEEPKFQIIHVKGDASNTSNLTVTQVAHDTVVKFKNIFTPSGDGWPYSNAFTGLQEGKYYADIYKVSATIDHSALLTSTSTILGEWTRNSASAGWALHEQGYNASLGWYGDTIDVSTNVVMDTTVHSATSATLTTYVYKLIRNLDTITFPNYINYLYPCDTNQTKFAYSIYVYDANATTVPYYPCDTTVYVQQPNKPTEVGIGITNVFPNPTSNNITVEYSLGENDNGSINVVNLLGEKMYTVPINFKTKGIYKTYIDVSNYAKGIYFVTLNSNTRVSQKKFVVLK